MNRLTYGLLVLVLALWLVIFYQFFSTVTPESPKVAFTAPEKTRPMSRVQAGMDSLLLSYRDPFLTEADAPAEDAGNLDLREEYAERYTETEIMPYVDWSAVRYFGMVKNGSRVVALLSINGKDYMVSEGDSIAEYTVESCNAHEARLRYLGQVGVVMLEQNHGVNDELYTHE